ncbi:MAG: 2-oxoacid:ferredoxin oxidoreductase subunit beta [Thaumarchaeota archaeon]|nr:2-oxoacid:ferredoxin oxidoreductase subunit beta [Nitrososphaerota archaeon]
MGLKLANYKSELHNDWCPGCGDFGILNAIQMTLADMQIPPHKVAVFSDIGCSGKTPHFIKVNGVHTLHGRVLPYATGAKLANPDLEIIAVGGDGGGMGIGAGHFVNIGRRNVDMMYIVFDNAVYGLTKGQASPTLKLNLKTKSLPNPNVNQAVNPIMLALASGFTFIARAYSFDIYHMKEVMKKAIQHKGLAFVDVLQPCPTYNDIHTKAWFSGLDRKNEKDMVIPRIYKLEGEGYEPRIKNAEDDSENYTKMAQVMEKSQEWGDRIPIGIFYQNEHISSYEDRINIRMDTYRKNPPAKQIIEKDGNPVTDIGKILDEFGVSTL